MGNGVFSVRSFNFSIDGWEGGVFSLGRAFGNEIAPLKVVFLWI